MKAIELYWHIVAAIAVLLLCLGFMEPNGKPRNFANELAPEDFIKTAFTMEWKWALALLGYTPLLLTGCVVYFYYLSDHPASSLPDIKAEVGIVALTAIVNMFFSIVLFLSEYFKFTFEHQPHEGPHHFLYRLAYWTGKYWHSFPLLATCVQAVVVGAIFVHLAFE